ncbi:MAG: nitroreductase family protein, partial [Clostridia bacterium]|nr:nitroreductase family protein [Clostridia bacterium]
MSIFKRVSRREFTDQKVSKSDLELILRAAMQAPSARNQQPW